MKEKVKKYSYSIVKYYNSCELTDFIYESKYALN